MSKKVDPLASIPVATTVRPAVNIQAGTAFQPPTPITSRKRRRLTGQQFKDARDFARKATGYNSSSPIWGKRLPEILVSIETDLVGVDEAINRGDYADAQAALLNALELNRELQKRVATYQVVKAQS